MPIHLYTPCTALSEVIHYFYSVEELMADTVEPKKKGAGWFGGIVLSLRKSLL